MSKLFEEKERIDVLTVSHLENQYDFFDRFNSKESDTIRNRLNEWFGNYPLNEQDELKNRFKENFSPAFYELFIYTLFTKQGFILSSHPELPGSPKRPDFLAKKGDVEFYIEATEVNDSPLKKGIYNRIDVVYDTINKINIKGMFFGLEEFVLKSTRQPNGKLLKKYFEKELEKISYEEVLVKITVNKTKSYIKYEDPDVLVVASLIPAAEQFREKRIERPLGIYPMSEYENPVHAIRNSIIKKSNRYGELDKPFILCVNSLGSFGLTDILAHDALFGENKLTYSTNPENKDEKFERCWDGVFGSPKNPKLKKVSGVFISHVSASSISSEYCSLTQNPFAKNPLDLDSLFLSYSYVRNSKIRKQDKKTITEILE